MPCHETIRDFTKQHSLCHTTNTHLCLLEHPQATPSVGDGRHHSMRARRPRNLLGMGTQQRVVAGGQRLAAADAWGCLQSQCIRNVSVSRSRLPFPHFTNQTVDPTQYPSPPGI